MNGKIQCTKHKQGYSVFYYQICAQHVLHVIKFNDIFPHLIEKDLAKWLDNQKLIFNLCIGLSPDSNHLLGQC